jgi:hypothetical protein
MSAPREKALSHIAFSMLTSFLQMRVAKCTTGDAFRLGAKTLILWAFSACRPRDDRPEGEAV